MNEFKECKDCINKWNKMICKSCYQNKPSNFAEEEEIKDDN